MSTFIDTATLTPRRRFAALWLQAIVLGIFMAASAAPTPLYRLYQEAWRFSPATLTVVFGVYAFGLLAALLTVGALSDHLGRKPVIFASLLLEGASLILFLAAGDTGTLIAARLVQGFATGAAMSAIGAALLDLDRKAGAAISGTAPLAGMALGALGTSILVVVAPLPLRLVYALLLAAAVAGGAILAVLPETAARRPGAWASLRPRVRIPAAARGAFLRVTPVNVAVWALGGFTLSLVPTLAKTVTGIDSPLVGGAVVAALTLSGALGIHLKRNANARMALIQGTVALAAGLAVLLAGVWSGSAPVLFAGTVVAGYGFGVGFLGCVRTLSPLAPPDQRAAMLAAFYVQSYLSFSVPVMLAGALTGAIGLVPATTVYALALIALALAGGVATLLRRETRVCTA